jgi:hypothetical protein
MKFSTNEDVEAPIDAVFEMLCDFESFERAAMRRGAEVQRVDQLVAPGVGMIWDAVFELRGKRREIQVEMVTFDHPNEILLETTSPGMIGSMSFDLMALSRARTKLADQKVQAADRGIRQRDAGALFPQRVIRAAIGFDCAPDAQDKHPRYPEHL